MDSIGVLILGIRARCAKVSQRQSVRVTKQLREHLSASCHQRTLSQNSLAILRGCEGVSSVLVGMRTTEYVADSLAVLQDPIEPIEKAMAEQIKGALSI